MRFHDEIIYPAPPATVFSMLRDTAFRSEVCVATGALAHDVDVAEIGDAVTVTTTRVMPAEVPELVRRFVGERITISQRERWMVGNDAVGRRADLLLRIVDAPATMQGSITLASHPDGCLETIAGDLRVTVPFVGGRIEAEVARALTLAIDREATVGRGYLASAGS